MTQRANLISILFTLGTAFGLASAASGQSLGPSHGQGDAEALATVHGKAILKADIDKTIEAELYSLQSKMYTIQERIYIMRKQAVDRMIEVVVLEDEARSRQLSVEALKKSLMSGKAEVSQAQIDRFYDDNRAGFDGLAEQQAKTEIRGILERKANLDRYSAALAELRGKWEAKLLFSPPLPPLLNLEDSGPTRGPKSAPIKIIEFADFQCPFCRLTEHVITQVMDRYGEQVRLTYKHLPLPSHPQSFMAAQASVCAGEQGRFWEYHDLLFSGGEDLSRVSLERGASGLGLDVSAFSKCMDSQASRYAVAADAAEAEKADIQATPTFFINGRILRGASSFEEFKKLIDREIESSGRRRISEPKN